MAALEGDLLLAANLPISTNLSRATTVTVAFVAIAVDGARPRLSASDEGHPVDETKSRDVAWAVHELLD